MPFPCSYINGKVTEAVKTTNGQGRDHDPMIAGPSTAASTPVKNGDNSNGLNISLGSICNLDMESSFIRGIVNDAVREEGKDFPPQPLRDEFVPEDDETPPTVLEEPR